MRFSFSSREDNLAPPKRDALCEIFGLPKAYRRFAVVGPTGTVRSARNAFQTPVSQFLAMTRECPDWHLILSPAHLHRALQSYADYYHNDRTHVALQKNALHARLVVHAGPVIRRRILGGLHRPYSRKPRK